MSNSAASDASVDCEVVAFGEVKTTLRWKVLDGCRISADMLKTRCKIPPNALLVCSLLQAGRSRVLAQQV
jgi:hypothetical protein